MKDYAKIGDRLHRESVVIDGLSYLYVGPSPVLDPGLVTATNVTVPEYYHTFPEAVDAVWKTRRIIDEDPNALCVRTTNDILFAKKEGRIGIIIGFQGTLPLETNIDRVGMFAELGARIIQLAYMHRTFTGDGCLEPRDGGLSLFGRSVVKELSRVGIVLDLSHVGERTSLEAIEAAEVPPIFSHSNPRSVTNSPRNISDEQIKEVANAGGVVGVCTWAPICWKNRPQQPAVDDYADHIDYVVELAGIDHVSIGTDSPCTDDLSAIAENSRIFASLYPGVAGPYRNAVGHEPEYNQPVGVPGIRDLRGITGCLLDRGYRPGDIQKILGGNLLRVFNQVWK